MLMTDIIAHKRNKNELTNEEIEFFINGVTNDTIPDYQISALLMAIYLNGLSPKETVELTLAMANSGDMLDLSSLGDKTIDKHSTGGVGDKTTLICAPIAAALGCKVAKMSGRGLGHTGGTVDKLEAISGYKTSVSAEEMLEITKKHGLCLVGHSGNFAPADKKLYAIRDVTSTVESMPLIASSIMSKKLAAGAKNILLDVKFGSGAFMKSIEEAESLAEKMVEIGNNAGRKTAAVITDMDIPLGRYIGNALEIKEALEILNGKGDSRLRELCIALAAQMHSLCFDTNIKKSEELAIEVLENGNALKKLCQSAEALGGDIKLLTGETKFPEPQAEKKLIAKGDGYITAINSKLVGKAAALSGAGRETLGEEIDLSAGIFLNKQYGEFVKKGEVLATVYGKQKKLDSAVELLEKAYLISKEMPKSRPLIYKIIMRYKNVPY